jgi:hypothetical protein
MDGRGGGVLTALQVAGLALMVFAAYTEMVYGAAARRILRRRGIRCSAWGRQTDSIVRFWDLAGEETRPWRGRVLRGARRTLLAGMLAGLAGFALLLVARALA